MALKPGAKSAITTKLPVCSDPVEFIELCCGPLYEWQRPIVRDLTAADRPRLAYIQIPRKNGKSRLAASVAIAELCDISKPNRQIFLIADSERNLKSALYYEITTMLRESNQLRDCVHEFKDRIECPETGSFIALRPNNLSASQSINPHLVLFDEVHMQRSDRIWNGMQLAGAARPDGLLLGITTPGYDLTSMAHGLYQRVRNHDPNIYGVIYEPSRLDCAADDETALIESNPILVDRSDMAEVFEFERTTLDEHDYRRFRLGQWTATATAWLPYGTWDALRHPLAVLEPLPIDPSWPVWLGFDGSYSGDSTALVGVAQLPGGGLHVFIVGCWENPGKKGWRVPRDEVNATVTQAMQQYNVQLLLCDPPYWESQIAEWAARWPKQVVEFPTYSIARMAPACTKFYSACMEKRVTHDGDKRMARHLSNAVVKNNRAGNYITKEDKDSPAKIDLAVAAIVAHSVAATTVPRQRTGVFVGVLGR